MSGTVPRVYFVFVSTRYILFGLWRPFEFPLRLSTSSTGWVHQSVPSSRGCARVAPVHRRRLQCPPSMGLHPLLAGEFTLSRFVCCQMDGSALLYHPASAPASSCLAPRRRLVARCLCFNSGVVIRLYAPQVCNAACNRAPSSPANARVLDPCLARRFSAYCHQQVSGVRLYRGAQLQSMTDKKAFPAAINAFVSSLTGTATWHVNFQRFYSRRLLSNNAAA